MAALIDLTGMTFGKLTVVGKSPRTAGDRNATYWDCVCSCGAKTRPMSWDLRRGRTKSCGCSTRVWPTDLDSNERRLLSKRKEYANNRDRYKQSGKAWKESNQVTAKKLARKSALKIKYGLTVAQYDAMHATQRGLCALCGKPYKGVGHIDHNHLTGKVRSILCGSCNPKLGHIENNRSWLRMARDYLRKHNDEDVLG